MPPPSVSVESKKQKERDRGRKRRQQLRRQGQARQLREVDSHETIRLVSQVHDVEDDVTSHRPHEHSHRGHPTTSSTSIQHLLPETSTFRDSSVSNYTPPRFCPPTAVSSGPLATRSPRDIRRTSGAFEAVTDSTSAGEPLIQGSSETAATAVSGLWDAAEEVQATAGRPQRDPALSERELTRLRVRAYRARQHPSRILQTAQAQDNTLFSNRINSENQCSAQGNPCSPQNEPTLPVRFHQGDDAQQATSDWRRINSSPPASSRTSASDFALAPLDIDDHYPIADDHYRSLSPDRSTRENPTFPAADRIQVGLPYLNSFIEALQSQETRSGLDFLESQTTTYDRALRNEERNERRDERLFRLYPRT